MLEQSASESSLRHTLRSLLQQCVKSAMPCETRPAGNGALVSKWWLYRRSFKIGAVGGPSVIMLDLINKGPSLNNGSARVVAQKDMQAMEEPGLNTTVTLV